MPLYLVEANTSYIGQRLLYDRVKENDHADAFHVFLVPDRFTFGVEKDLCRYCFPNGYINADVQSFSRYAANKVGGRIKKNLSKEGTVVLLKKIVEDNAPKLKYYKDLTGYSFAKELFAAIASLRSGGVNLDEVAKQAEEGEGVFYNKLHDVALLGKEYERVLSEKYSDTISRLDSLNEYLQKADLKNTYFYILGFNVYSQQQIEIITTLAKRSAGVALSYVKIIGTELCLNRQISIIKEICASEEVEIIEVTAHQNVPEPQETVRKSIFAGGNKTVKPEDRIVLFRESDPYAEITAVAREIAYLVKKNGYRYNEIAVVCNNADLLPVLYETFDRCDIPCFIDKGYAVAEGIFARFITSLFIAAEKNTAEAYFRLARQALVGLSVEEQRSFRAYCTQYNVNYNRFEKPFELGDYEQAEAIRSKLTSLTAELKKCVCYKDYCSYISDLLAREDIKSKLEKMASSDDPRIKAYADTEGIEKLVEELNFLIGEEQCSLGDFLSTFCSAIGDMKTVLRPEYCDTVFIGNTEESRFNDIKAIFIVGASDGFFPIKSGDGLIFTASDNERMRGIGLTVFPSPVEKNAFERFVVRDLIAKPSERLYIGCSVADLAGEMQVPGEGVEEIKVLTGTEKVMPLEKFRALHGIDALNYRLINVKNAYYEYLCDNIPQEYRSLVKELLLKNGLLKEIESPKEETFSEFFKKEGEQYLVSSSQLEKYFSCPFKHFLSHGLKIKPEEDYSLDNLTMGNIVHRVMELFFKKCADKVYSGEKTDDEAEKTINFVFSDSKYKSFYLNPLYRHYLDRLRIECKRAIDAISENMRHSKFRPKGFEVMFGSPNDAEPILITANNCQFRLNGKIDRVDEYKDYVVIVDYKTGSVGDLSDIYYGKKLQLYVYLKKYLNEGLKPAGVFYQPIPSGGSDKGRSYAMIGQMLRNEGIFRALDDRVDSLEKGQKSSAVSFDASLSDKKNLFDKEDFRNVTGYVDKLVEKALCEITEGYAAKKPLPDACKYCDYVRICDEGEREFRTTHAMNPCDFAEEKDEL